MKIAICGSMYFAKDMLRIKEELEKRKHKVTVPAGTKKHADGIIKNEDKWEKLELNPIKAYYEEIKKNDAIIVINKDKNKIKGYVGGNSLIEIAFAYVLGKRIFLLNPIPEMSYSDEITAMKPNVINNNFDLIK
jgi:predicted RNA-binding protein with PUA domain